MRPARLLLACVFALPMCGLSGGCQDEPEPKAWAIALHGGAGTIPRGLPVERVNAVKDGLRAALEAGKAHLAQGGSALDAVEEVIRILEDNPEFNAGRGAVFTHEGNHELDASIMDGRDLATGAVAGVTRVRHPITAARKVMEQTRHVLLAGPGADRFAEEQGLSLVDNAFFSTERREEQWRARLDEKKGTVGVVALDREGHLAAGTSTGGLTDKRYGRVGDSPIAGAGTYADDRAAAVSCTGTGEEFIRNAVAHSVVARVLWLDEDVQRAADHVVHEVLDKGDGGLIALDRRGRVAFSYSTTGMYRGAADSEGRFEVSIWEAEPAADKAP